MSNIQFFFSEISTSFLFTYLASHTFRIYLVVEGEYFHRQQNLFCSVKQGTNFANMWCWLTLPAKIGAIALSYPPYCYWWLIMKKRSWKLCRSPNPNPRGVRKCNSTQRYWCHLFVQIGMSVFWHHGFHVAKLSNMAFCQVWLPYQHFG